MNASQTSPNPPNAGGDPREIDKLACAATRVTREAEVTQESQAQLDDLRKRYTAARVDYGAVWAAARTEVAVGRSELDEARKVLLKNHLSDAEKSGVDKAWSAVEKELQQCVADEEMHTIAPSTPDGSVAAGETAAQLAGRVHTYRTEVSERTAVLEGFFTEIDEVPNRVATVRPDIDATVEASRSTAPAPNPVPGAPGPAATAYARSLVAGWRLDHVFHGFTGVDDYVGIVGRALEVVLRLWGAIVALEGAQAYAQCLAEPSETDPCAVLRADPLAAVLTAYQPGTPAQGTAP